MKVTIDILPTGPHKNWAIFLREVLDELGWSRDQTCEMLQVQIGWLKKALDGKDLDGAYRIPFQKKLAAKWDEYRKDKPQILPLEWPSYIENAHWDKKHQIDPIGKMAQLSDVIFWLKQELEDCQKHLETINLPSQSSSIAPEVSGEDQVDFSRALGSTFEYLINLEDNSLLKKFVPVEKLVSSEQFDKAGKRFFQIAEKVISRSKHNKLNYRENAFHALNLFYVATVLLISGKRFHEVFAMLKRQIEHSVPEGDVIITAKLQTLLSVAYHYSDDETKGRRTGKYTKCAIAAAQSALSHLSPDKFPSEWVQAQCLVGSGLLKQASLRDDKTSLELLKEAEAVLRAALEVSDQETLGIVCVPLGESLLSQYKTLYRLGQKEDADRLVQPTCSFLNDSIRKIYSGQYPDDWAKLQCFLGLELMLSIGPVMKKDPSDPSRNKEILKILSKSINAFKYGAGALCMANVDPKDKTLNELIRHLLVTQDIYNSFKTSGTEIPYLEKLVASRKRSEPQ